MLFEKDAHFAFTIWADDKTYSGHVQPLPDFLDCGVPYKFHVHVGETLRYWFMGYINMNWPYRKLENASDEFTLAILEYIILWYE